MRMLRLLHFPLCPFSRKVRIVLREKELEAELEAVEPWRQAEALATLNPAAEVPVLIDGQRVICDSWAICEYLEETRPERRLLALDPVERAEVRRLVAWFDVKFMREVTDLIWREKVLKFAVNRDTPNSAAVRVGVANLHAHLNYIAYLFEQRNWLAGDHISLADVAAGAQLSVLDYLGDVPWDAHPGAKLYYARLKSRPSVRPLLADRAPCLKPAAHYDDLDF
jgi:glutathione S-transferase